MSAAIVLPLRRVDVHGVDGTARAALAFVCAAAILRLAFRELRGNFGVVPDLSLPADVFRWHVRL
jgi:hypothetical protein